MRKWGEKHKINQNDPAMEEALKAQQTANEAKQEALKAQEIADEASKRALKAQEIADEASKRALEAQENAVEAKQEAVEAKQEAVEATKEAGKLKVTVSEADKLTLEKVVTNAIHSATETFSSTRSPEEAAKAGLGSIIADVGIDRLKKGVDPHLVEPVREHFRQYGMIIADMDDVPEFLSEQGKSTDKEGSVKPPYASISSSLIAPSFQSESLTDVEIDVSDNKYFDQYSLNHCSSWQKPEVCVAVPKPQLRPLLVDTAPTIPLLVQGFIGISTFAAGFAAFKAIKFFKSKKDFGNNPYLKDPPKIPLPPKGVKEMKSSQQKDEKDLPWENLEWSSLFLTFFHQKEKNWGPQDLVKRTPALNKFSQFLFVLDVLVSCLVPLFLKKNFTDQSINSHKVLARNPVDYKTDEFKNSVDFQVKKLENHYKSNFLSLPTLN